MRWNSFARSALFAALGAAAYLPWLVLVGPLLGVRTALALYLVGLAACYVAGLAPRGTRGLGGALLAGGLGVALVVGADSLAAVVMGLAAVLAAARSGILYRARPERAIVTEALLVLGGLGLARFLLASSLFSVMLAIWAFFLVQGIFFLVGGVAPRRESRALLDSFEHAYAQAAALLEEERV